jgi:hypothetical protein
MPKSKLGLPLADLGISPRVSLINRIHHEGDTQAKSAELLI